MDLLKNYAVPITLGVIGIASLMQNRPYISFMYNQNLSESTVSEASQIFQQEVEEKGDLANVENKLIELSSNLPRPITFKQQVSKIIYSYIFAKAIEIEKKEVTKILECCEKSANIESAINQIIDILRQNQDQLSEIGPDVIMLIQSLGLQSEQTASIRQCIQHFQVKQQQSIKILYFQKAKEYLQQKIALLNSPQGVALLKSIQKHDWRHQDSSNYHSTVINALFDCFIFKRKPNLLQEHFFISIAIQQGQAELKQQIQTWSTNLLKVYKAIKGIR